MTQIWLFSAGGAVGAAGVLLCLVFAVRNGSARPTPGVVGGLVITIAGLALTVAGACVG
jgi:hypothetical protein